MSSSRNCGPVLRAAKIEGLFEVRVDGLTLAEEGLPGKPRPDTYLYAGRLLETDPEHAVVAATTGLLAFAFIAVLVGAILPRPLSHHGRPAVDRPRLRARAGAWAGGVGPFRHGLPDRAAAHGDADALHR